jgi:hypothetical protein
MCSQTVEADPLLGGVGESKENGLIWKSSGYVSTVDSHKSRKLHVSRVLDSIIVDDFYKYKILNVYHVAIHYYLFVAHG